MYVKYNATALNSILDSVFIIIYNIVVKYLCGIGWWNAPMLDVDGLDVAGGMRLGFHMHDPLASGGGGGAAAADSGNCRDSPTE